MSKPPLALIEAMQTVYDAESIDINAFQDFPIVTSRLTNLSIAYDSSPEAPAALEFGVFKGASIRALASANKSQAFYGFDSFEGLPEAWHRSDLSTYEAGHFALSELPTVPKNVELIKGFFEDTLEEWLEKNTSPIGFSHIDSDLYSSAKFIMNQLASRYLNGAVIVFDELGDWKDEGVYPLWREGEWLALKEWLGEQDFCFRILGRGENFEAAIQIFMSPPPPIGRGDLLQISNRLWKNKQHGLAIALLEELIIAHPNWLRIYNLLAMRQISENQHEAALQTISTAAKVAEKNPDDHYAKAIIRLGAQCRFKMGEFDAAHSGALEYVETCPDDAAGYRLLAQTANKLCKYEVSKEAWLKAFHISGDRKYRENWENQKALCAIRPAFRGLSYSGLLIQKLLDDYEFETVLDIGSGAGEQAAALRSNGKVVTELDYGGSEYFADNVGTEKVIIGDFLEVELPEAYDCLLASHVLEHQLNVHAFLKKAHSCLKEGGAFGLSVPPLKHEIVGGHVSLWNAGLVLYHLVLAGFDCRDAWVRKYGYNISVIVRKRTIKATGLVFDTGDVNTISQYLPNGLREGFNGDIRALN
ncbi:MAG: hypothetical protein Hens3KO_07620 [Henriciella sp.]